MEQEKLIRFLRCRTTPEEEHEILDWLDADPENRRELESLDFLFASAVLNGQEKTTVRRHGRHILAFAAGISAIAAAVVLSVFVGRRTDDVKTIPTGEFTVTAERGQQSEISLPDGSHIWLNSGSTVSYGSAYGLANRTVNLDGEAYFEVAKGQRQPFIVKTSNLSVKALGTAFNIRSYKGENETVTLVEGKVLASSDSQEEILLPYQRVVFDTASGGMGAPEPVDSLHAVPWRSNEIILANDNLTAIAAMLERMYNVEVLFLSDGIRDYTFTGRLPNSSLKNILDLISETTPVVYDMHDNIIELSANQK